MDTSHALVDFGDEGTSIIRFSRIVKGSICEGICRVNWGDGQEYDGALIIAGKPAIYNYPAILLMNGLVCTRYIIFTGYNETSKLPVIPWMQLHIIFWCINIIMSQLL